MKVTVGEVIKMLSKCNWDDECTVIDDGTNESIQSTYDRQHFSHKIIGITQNTQIGTQIIIAE